MTKEQTAYLFTGAMQEHGPTFGVRLLIGFLKGAEIACASEGVEEAAELAGELVRTLEKVADMTELLEEML